MNSIGGDASVLFGSGTDGSSDELSLGENSTATEQKKPEVKASYADVHPWGQSHVPKDVMVPFAAMHPWDTLAENFMCRENF